MADLEKQKVMVNEKTIRTWFELFHGEGDVVEIRVLGANKKTWSGYYRSADAVLNAINSVQEGGVYSCINSIKESCYDRAQHERLVMSPKATTSDNDIEGRRWILVDLDPKRSSDTNSTDAEKAKARDVMVKVGVFLQQQGFSAPVVADSGNGWHLYYKVKMANDDDSAQLVKDFLQVLDMLFSDDSTDVDTSVFNAARIVKVIGTKSNKGSDTDDRPQRYSKFVKIPTEVTTTDIDYVAKVAAMLPHREAPSRSNNFGEQRFDLDAFIHEHGINVVKRSAFKGGTKYILECCPFDANHKAPDSAVFKMSDGSYGFKCLHNSCSHRTWKDFRLRYDPQAYDRKSYNEFVSRIRYERPIQEMPIKETEELGKKWLTMSDIQWVDISKIPTLPTGFYPLDRRIKGMMVGDVTVLSGLSGAGKTSWLDCVLLNVVDKGFKAAVWSGELQAFRFQSWIDQIAAGKAHVVKQDGYDNMWSTPKMVADKIHNWIGDRLVLYNNDYGHKWSQIFSDIESQVDAGCQLIVLDNLAALDIESTESGKYDQQTKFITAVKEMAKKRNIHVIVVCHPRKEMTFLRKESISGTADLTNLADNVLIIHRVGKDFEERAKLFFRPDKVEEMLGYDCVIEVAKNRSYGVVDYLCGMYYEPETRRLKCDRADNRIYGWYEHQTQSCIALPPSPYEPINIQDIDDWPMPSTEEKTPF